MELTTNTLVDFLRRELAGFGKAVLGLSGGVDSAVVCALCVRALGAKNVHTIYMPYRTSAPQSAVHARMCVETYGAHYQIIDITAQIDEYFSDDKATPLRRGNKMSRERMSILYDQSASLGTLVIGTSNKTELMLGYGTQYGDMASALNPIGDLYKTQIFALARHLQVPEAIINKTPSADFWPGQSDEAEIGYSYAQIDALLADMLDKNIPVKTLKTKYPAEFVDNIAQRIERSAFKRRMPLIAQLSSKK